MAKAKRPASTPKPGQAGQSARPKSATGATSATATKARPAASGSAASTAQGGRLEAIRARTGQQPAARAQNRRKVHKQPWYKGAGGIWSAIGVVFLVVVIIFVIAGHQSSTLTPISQTVYTQVTGISPQTVATVGAGGIANPLQAAPATTPLAKDASGRPIVLYVGAEYCPYCAAERWSMIAALSRFGTFSGLKEMTSSDTDTPASVPTFSFEGATYTSQYITFTAKEIQDRVGQNLDTLSGAENDLFNTYDSPPYVQSNSAGGIPFVSYGTQFFTHSAGYTVQILNAQTRDSIAAQLDDPKSPVTQAIVGNANWLTAAICKLTNNKPANVCSAAPIPDLMKQLPAAK